MGTVTRVLGIEFTWKRHEDRNLDVHMDQTTFVENLVQMAGLPHNTESLKPIPFRNGHSIDSINHVHLPPSKL